MNRFSYTLTGLLLVIFIAFLGCSSSQDTQQQEKEATDQPAQTETQASQPSQTQDTVEATNPEQGKPEQTGYESSTVPSQAPMTQTGNYAVQIGAFKMGDKAEEIAGLARNRFQLFVKTFMDRETGLTKVLVGSFTTKEEARAFRDQIAKQYMEDYKDAWVTEIPKE